MNEEKEHILVIRLGALGDLVFCFQAFHEIREAHPNAEIALLTRGPFADFAGKMPWFDSVIVETHPRFADLGGWMNLTKEIKKFAPTRIYDLQGKSRQSVLYALLGGPFRTQWSGAAPFCKFPRLWPPQPGMHFKQFLAAQLRNAGVPEEPTADLRWFDAQTAKFGLPANYVALIAGCSPDAPHKRWPPVSYGELANKLHEQGFKCVTVGTQTDTEAINVIKTTAPDVIDLAGRTSLFELAGILRRAVAVIGNDTGPLHVAAAVGAPTLALFSGQSSAAWSSPPGAWVAVKQSENLADLSVADVGIAFDLLLQDAEHEDRQSKSCP